MPPLVIPNTVRVGLIWSLSGQEFAVNVLHYIVPPGQVVTGATATDLAVDVENAYGASLLELWQPNEVALTRVTVRDIREAALPEFSAAVAGSGGTASEAILPLSTSLCITLRTAKAGRRYRGRVYLPGFAENANTDGTAAVEAQTAGEAFITDLMDNTVQTNGWTLGVMSQANGTTLAVISAECRDGVWDTQRRRAYPGI